MTIEITPFIQVVTTVEKQDQARELTARVVADRLAACAQIVGPIESTYHWEGRIENGQEWMCVFKTSRELYPELERAIRERHPYSCPEILAVPIVAGNRAYLNWLREELRRG